MEIDEIIYKKMKPNGRIIYVGGAHVVVYDGENYTQIWNDGTRHSDNTAHLFHKENRQ